MCPFFEIFFTVIGQRLARVSLCTKGIILLSVQLAHQFYCKWYFRLTIVTSLKISKGTFQLSLVQLDSINSIDQVACGILALFPGPPPPPPEWWGLGTRLVWYWSFSLFWYWKKLTPRNGNGHAVSFASHTFSISQHWSLPEWSAFSLWDSEGSVATKLRGEYGCKTKVRVWYMTERVSQWECGESVRCERDRQTDRCTSPGHRLPLVASVPRHWEHSVST